MKHSNDYLDSLDHVRHDLAKRANVTSKQARAAWNRRSDAEKDGIYAGLTILLLGGLLALIWSAGRRAGSRYVELPRRDDEK